MMKKTIAILMVSLVFFSTSAIAQEQTTAQCSIDCKVLQAVLDYVSFQPYKDVFKFVQAIQENAKSMPTGVLKEDDETSNKDRTTDQCTIDCKTLQAVLDYISRQPYKDVFKLIQKIQETAKPMSPEPPIKDDISQKKDMTID
jgi:hypothetical protein